MAGAGRGDGKGPGVGKLEAQIYCIKYTLFCFNVVLWVSTFMILSLGIINTLNRVAAFMFLCLTRDSRYPLV